MKISNPPSTNVQSQQWAHRFKVDVDISYGSEVRQRMDAYEHINRIGEPNYYQDDRTIRNTLVWIHGGGWKEGDKSAQLPFLIPYLERGWNVYSLNYRIGANTAPEAIDDVMCAYKAVVNRLLSIGQSTNKIVVSGSSAGGHLALVVGLLNSGERDHYCKSISPKAVVNWFGITDIKAADEFLQKTNPSGNFARIWAGSENNVAKISEMYSPVQLINQSDLPIISVHGNDDTVVPYSQADNFHKLLLKNHNLISIEGGNHGGFSDEQFNYAYLKIFQFLSNH